MTVFLGTVFTQWGLQAVTLQVVALEQPPGAFRGGSSCSQPTRARTQDFLKIMFLFQVFLFQGRMTTFYRKCDNFI